MKINQTLLLLVVFLSLNMIALAQQSQMAGAWESGGETKFTKIVTESFFSTAIYKDKEFVGTLGGKWTIEGNELVETYEFNTLQPDLVGTVIKSKFSLSGNDLTLTASGKTEKWKRLDDGTPGKLAGAWLITGRMTNGSVNKMTPGARRTMKILSGTRFQWIAYNVDSKEFFGTGGGTYTTENGKYTEKILFFSRDNSRVGSSLQFDFSLENGNWRHKGLSSKGDPIDEVWTKREKIGL